MALETPSASMDSLNKEILPSNATIHHFCLSMQAIFQQMAGFSYIPAARERNSQ